MPTYWYAYRDCIPRSGDTEELLKWKEFNRRIVASEKPYFMTYVYPPLRTKYNTYVQNTDNKAACVYAGYGIFSVDDLESYDQKTDDMNSFIEYYYKNMPTGNSPCVINKICWLAEKEFPSFSKTKACTTSFDFEKLKSHVPYSRATFNKIHDLYLEYESRMGGMLNENTQEKFQRYSESDEKVTMLNIFRSRCFEICSNEDELCDVILDMCYTRNAMKSFVWDIVGETIVRNLMRRNGNKYHVPVSDAVDSTDGFIFGGKKMTMIEVVMQDDEPDNT